MEMRTNSIHIINNNARDIFLMFVIAILCVSCSARQTDKVVLAYVTSWSSVMPDPQYVTHINYAFGHVNETFDGIKIDNEARLKEITNLKKESPSLKVLLSIGGWGSGRFSEMAADSDKRLLFAKDCKRVIKEYNLDGVDIDWEFPTSSMADISSSPNDTDNFTLLMKDIRKTIGNTKLLTLATHASGKYIDFSAIDDFIDFVNIMTYDISSPPKHHAGLYRSEHSGFITGEESVKAHVDAGIPFNKLTMGIPFYGRAKGNIGNFMNYKDILKLKDYNENWDDVAKAPYLTDSEGEFVCSYENTRSIAHKCDFIGQNKMLGAMYWEYDGDDAEGSLRKAVYKGIMEFP